ncbi:hypothetical protein K2X92_00325, partial [Candidatus Gracilibacteria bacterium]|nr:hypothetical protein [Candidatus Gracilibacteria bacterium]
MSLWKKTTDWFTGMDDPLGNGTKNGQTYINTSHQIHDQIDTVMDARNTTPSISGGSVGLMKIPEATIVNPKIEEKVNTKKSSNLALDVLDISRVIDIYAESQAVEAFDNEMGKERKGAFQKMKGFFARSFQRMGRDAWIDTKKRENISIIKIGLNNGTYSEEFLREHVLSGDIGITSNAHLNHEKIQEVDSLPKKIQLTVDSWMNTVAQSPERIKLTLELKKNIEEHYPALTTDLSQLEKSLIRLEKAKISSEIDIMETKLNILDIGRIEQGNGKHKEGWFVQISDTIQNSMGESKLPDWIKQKIIGGIRHPNTAAVLAALGTRTGVSILAGATVAAGFSGGFLLPIIAGSTAGGLFASIRAHREMRDRTAQVDRRGAMGLETGKKDVDGESSNSSHQTNIWQHPTIDLYNRVVAGKDSSEKIEDALISSIYYLTKHRVGREQGINMLSYELNKSISRQHVEMIQLINTVFPNLVSNFNNGSLFDTQNQEKEAIKVRELYIQINELAKKTMKNRAEEEGKYAIKQGFIFGTTAAVVGGSIGAAIHGLISGSGGYWNTINTPSTIIIHYPDNLQAHTNIHRGFWYDNGTPAPKFDNTELMIQTDKSGSWNVSRMLSQTASTLHNGVYTISASDFTGQKIQAVLTPVNGGPSFILPIDAQGNIQIPTSLKSAFLNKSFATLEVGIVKVGSNGDIDLNPIATAVGKGNMIFEKITETIPGKNSKEWINVDSPWVGIPIGANKYHELKEQKPNKSIDSLGEPHNIYGNIPTDSVKNEGIEGNNKDIDGSISGNKSEIDKTGMLNEKNRLDDLWNEIVKIRQLIEGKKNGTNILSDVAEKNISETLTYLLNEYHKQRKLWNANSRTKNNDIYESLYEDANLYESLYENIDVLDVKQSTISNTQESLSPLEKRKERIETGVFDNTYSDSIRRQKHYISHIYDSENPEELKTLSSQIPKMNSKCILSINLPAYKEGRNIYKALYESTIRQLDKDGTPLDPDLFEINILVNRPNKNQAYDIDTINEIEKFKNKYPQYHIHYICKTFSFTGKPIMGKIYKTIADIAVYRNLDRMDSYEKKRLILRTGGADAKEKNPYFFSTIIDTFIKHPNIHVYKSESRYPKELLKKIPLFHFMSTFSSGINRLYTRGKSNIGLGSYAAELYAQVGGFDKTVSIAEEIH